MKKLGVLCFLILCLGLFGCGQEQEAEPETSQTEEETAAFTMVAVPVHEEILFDLDGDGSEDTLLYAILDDEGMSFNLSANDIGIDQDGCYMADTAYIIDLDTTDQYKEVAVSEYGPSDDLMVHILRFDGSAWTVLGYIPGFVALEEDGTPGETTVINGDGTVDTLRRGEVVSTWFFTAHYQMEGDTLVWQEAAAYDMETPVTLLVDLPLTATPEGSEVVATLLTGTETVIKQTDNFSWISFPLEDGTMGYARLGDDGFSIAALGLSTYDVFEGLNFAD